MGGSEILNFVVGNPGVEYLGTEDLEIERRRKKKNSNKINNYKLR